MKIPCRKQYFSDCYFRYWSIQIYSVYVKWEGFHQIQINLGSICFYPCSYTPLPLISSNTNQSPPKVNDANFKYLLIMTKTIAFVGNGLQNMRMQISSHNEFDWSCVEWKRHNTKFCLLSSYEMGSIAFLNFILWLGEILIAWDCCHKPHSGHRQSDERCIGHNLFLFLTMQYVAQRRQMEQDFSFKNFQLVF